MRLGFERIPHRRPGERPTNNGSMDGSIHRLQWVGQERRTTTLESFVPWFGEDRSARPRAVCPDKRKDCVQVVREAASQARHLPDRLHLVPAFTRRAEPWSPGKAHHTAQLHGSLRDSPEDTATAPSTHQPDSLSGSGRLPTQSGRTGPSSRRARLGRCSLTTTTGLLRGQRLRWAAALETPPERTSPGLADDADGPRHSVRGDCLRERRRRPCPLPRRQLLILCRIDVPQEIDGRRVAAGAETGQSPAKDGLRCEAAAHRPSGVADCSCRVAEDGATGLETPAKPRLRTWSVTGAQPASANLAQARSSVQAAGTPDNAPINPHPGVRANRLREEPRAALPPGPRDRWAHL